MARALARPPVRASSRRSTRAAQPPPRARHRAASTGRRFEEVKQLDEAERDRFGEIVFRFFFGTLKHTRRAAGDPHPGNYLLLDDGRVGFLDFGLMRVVDADYLEGERALAQAVARGDAEAVARAASPTLGYLPEPDAFDPERLLEQIRPPASGTSSPASAASRPAYVAELIERGSSPRSPYFEEMRRETIPPQALLIRRMEGLVLSTLGELRAGADWSRARQRVLGRRAAEHAARRAGRARSGDYPDARARGAP